MIVINLFGEPCSGKTTGAAYIFSKLKMKGYNIELVTEYAKDLVWEKSSLINDQIYVFAEQQRRLKRLKDKVDIIITDSPLFLSIVYHEDINLYFDQLVLNVFEQYNNINFLIQNKKEYNPIGRIHTEEESEAIRNKIISSLDFFNIPYETIDGNEYAYDVILKKVEEKINDTDKS